MPTKSLAIAMHWNTRCYQRTQTAGEKRASRVIHSSLRTKTAGSRSLTSTPHLGFSRTSHGLDIGKDGTEQQNSKTLGILLTSALTKFICFENGHSWHTAFFFNHTNVYFIYLNSKHTYSVSISSSNWKIHARRLSSSLLSSADSYTHWESAPQEFWPLAPF